MYFIERLLFLFLFFSFRLSACFACNFSCYISQNRVLKYAGKHLHVRIHTCTRRKAADTRKSSIRTDWDLDSFGLSLSRLNQSSKKYSFIPNFPQSKTNGLQSTMTHLEEGVFPWCKKTRSLVLCVSFNLPRGEFLKLNWKTRKTCKSNSIKSSGRSQNVQQFTVEFINC